MTTGNHLKTDSIEFSPLNFVYTICKIEGRDYLISPFQHKLVLLLPILGWRLKYKIYPIDEETKERLWIKNSSKRAQQIANRLSLPITKFSTVEMRQVNKSKSSYSEIMIAGLIGGNAGNVLFSLHPSERGLTNGFFSIATFVI